MLFIDDVRIKDKKSSSVGTDNADPFFMSLGLMYYSRRSHKFKVTASQAAGTSTMRCITVFYNTVDTRLVLRSTEIYVPAEYGMYFYRPVWVLRNYYRYWYSLYVSLSGLKMAKKISQVGGTDAVRTPTVHQHVVRKYVDYVHTTHATRLFTLYSS